ncbi:hypothetical protein, partial [Rhizobium sp. Root1203]|uniref:hypothetical protein n=1 Tax=Rhizobium sp. Root1203 TaxID=1736427 RepID=UPI000A86530C
PVAHRVGGKVHMAQFSMEIMRPTGSVLRGNQQLRWQFADLLRTITSRPTSRNLCGYWQCAAQNIVDQVWLQGEPPD